MFILYSDTLQDFFDHFYSKQEATKTSESVYNPYNQRSEKNYWLIPLP